VSATGEAAAKPASQAVTGQPVRFTNPGAVSNVATALRSDGSLITIGTNGTVYVWDLTAHQVTEQLAAPRGADFQQAAVSPDGDTMAVQASGGAAYILRGAASPTETLPAGERLYPGSIATAGLTFATGDAAGTGADVWTDAGASSTPAVTLTNPDGGADVTSVALSVDASIVAASDDSGHTYLWNANNGTRTHVLEPPDRSVVTSSVFAFGGGVLATHLLVTGNRDGRAYLWNADTGALIRSVRDPSGIVDTVAISAGGGLLATAGGNAIYLWDATTGASLGTISDPGGAGVSSLAFDMMDSQLAVADRNGTTYVWTLAD
jgi:WD40 repeat protein